MRGSVSLVLCVGGLLSACGPVPSSGKPPIVPPPADVTVTPDATGFEVVTTATGRSTHDAHAWTALGDAFGELPNGGSVYLAPGTYGIGRDTVVLHDAAWKATSTAVVVTNGVPGVQGLATRIDVPYPPPAAGLIARVTLGSPLDLSGVQSLGMWMDASLTFTERNVTPRTSPLKVVLSHSPDCSTRDYAIDIRHSERVTKGWKYYKIPGYPGLAHLPPGLPTIRCIGLALWDSPPQATPKVRYSVTIDDLHAEDGAVFVPANITLFGAGLDASKLVLGDHANQPVLTVTGANVEISDLDIDGNYDAQDAIDQCAGIYGPAGADHLTLDHLHIHHTKGTGIKLRGSHIKIYENRIEWTENASVGLSYTPSFVDVYDNTLRYAFNDDDIYIKSAHDITVSHNVCDGMTTALLASGDEAVPRVLRDKPPLGDGGIRVEAAYNVTVDENLVVDASDIGATIADGCHDVTFEHNRIVGSAHRGLVAKNWTTAIHDVHLIGNEVSQSGAQGMDIEGTHNEIRDNWTHDNAGGGVTLKGTKSYGDGNYFPDGTKGDWDTSNQVSTAKTPPILPTFAAGAIW